jgi:hypothetical protein
VQQINLDPYTVVTALLGITLGPKYAPELAPLVVGTLPALKTRVNTGGAVVFVLALTVWSCGMTGTIVMLASGYLDIPQQWLIFPVAVLCSAIGERWLSVPSLVFFGAIEWVRSGARRIGGEK